MKEKERDAEELVEKEDGEGGWRGQREKVRGRMNGQESLRTEKGGILLERTEMNEEEG